MKVKVLDIFIILSIVLNVNSIKFQRTIKPITINQAYPCGTGDIISYFNDLKAGYNVTVKRPLYVATDVRLVFDSEAAVFLDNAARFSSVQDNVYNIFNVILLKNSNKFTFTVKGHAPPYSPPYLTSLKIDGEEYCRNHNLSYFENFPVGVTKRSDVPDKYCGKRKVLQTELIVNGFRTKPGDWPWHVALYRQEDNGLKYTCGGTLITKHFVLTAAHCTTVRGIPVVPDILGVFLGKYHLYTSDETIQERQVFQVIVHDEYSWKSLRNDISLLKLKTEAVFNNYVQPACLWYEEIHTLSADMYGTVVGWGFDRTDTLSHTLHAATIPRIDDITCIYSNTVFYAESLRGEKKFCAGYRNGTSPCNGDSGGGFLVFVPDLANSANDSKVLGAWYIRGIVSSSLSRTDQAICDSNSYALFTDVLKYLNWIRNNIK